MQYANLRTLCFFVLLQVATTCCLKSASADLVINLDFTDFATGAPADGSATLGGATVAQAQTVITTAAQYWETAFAGSSSSIAWSTNIGGTLTQNISVAWGTQVGGTLAAGSTSWLFGDGRWRPGTAYLSFDNDGSSKFFVDATPQQSSEWSQFSERDLDFNGVSVNSERIHYDASAGSAKDNYDMLTVAIHEMGHALGFLVGFPAYEASDVGSDNDIDITSGPFMGAEIDVSSGHTNFTITDPVAGISNPSVMAGSIVPGARKLLTEADIAIVAQFLEFEMSTVNFNPQLSAVPEPSSFALLGLGLLYVMRRRRKKPAGGRDGTMAFQGRR